MGLFIHVGLSLLTYSVCSIVALYSIQLVWIDRALKNKKLPFSPMIPPLMTVERHFFRLMLIGEILLTIVLISGSYHLSKTFAHKTSRKLFFFLGLDSLWECTGWSLEAPLAWKKSGVLCAFRYHSPDYRLFW